jgi:hypothetical protein
MTGIHGQGVFVIAEAEVMAEVALVGAAVDNALRIMGVA